MYSQVVRFGDPCEAERPEQDERAAGETGQDREQRRHEGRDRHDRDPLGPVGEPPHRNRTERVEQAGSRRDEHDGAAADVEGLAQLGLDRLHGVERELVERYEEAEHDEHPRAALGEGAPEVDRLGVDPRKQVIGEDDLLLGASLRFLTCRFFVEDRGCERSGAALGLAS